MAQSLFAYFFHLYNEEELFISKNVANILQGTMWFVISFAEKVYVFRMEMTRK